MKKELEKLDHTVNLLGNAQNIIELIKHDKLNCDIVYNTVEGVASRNREGIIPALLEAYSIPYIGTDAFGLSLTLNKALTKIIAQHYGIKVPHGFLVKYPSGSDIVNNLKGLHFPIIIKPNFEGNSSGISVCYDISEAQEKIVALLDTYCTDIICEEFILGEEITVPYIDTAPVSIWDVTTVDVQKTPDFWLDKNWKQNGDYHNIVTYNSNVIHVFYLSSKSKYDVNALIKSLNDNLSCVFLKLVKLLKVKRSVEVRFHVIIASGNLFLSVNKRHGKFT